MKLKKEQVDIIYNEAKQIVKDYSCLRLGQAFYNTLYEEYPEVADSIVGTDLDPFYDNNKLDKCIAAITE